MNKKILFVSVLAVFMLLALAFASTVSSNTPKNPKKESPLFGIRTNGAIRDKIGDFVRRFVGERVFFLPFNWLRYKIFDDSMSSLFNPTCFNWPCTYEDTTNCDTCIYPGSCK